MRKKQFCALMISLCLLVSCGPREEKNRENPDELALQIRTELLGATTCTATAELTADYGQRVHDFTLSAVYTGDRGGVITVIKPEIVAGVAVKIAAGSTLLEYDGASIETGSLSPDGLSPLSALPALWHYAREGYMDSCGFETLDGGKLLKVLYRDPDCPQGTGEEAVLRFDPATHRPVDGAIYQDGTQVISCTLTGFVCA